MTPQSKQNPYASAQEIAEKLQRDLAGRAVLFRSAEHDKRELEIILSAITAAVAAAEQEEKQKKKQES